MTYSVKDMLMESGLFWCVFRQDGRLVRAFHGEEAEDEARNLAADLNGGAS